MLGVPRPAHVFHRPPHGKNGLVAVRLLRLSKRQPGRCVAAIYQERKASPVIKGVKKKQIWESRGKVHIPSTAGTLALLADWHGWLPGVI